MRSKRSGKTCILFCFCLLVNATEPFGEQAEVTMRTNFLGTMCVCHALFPLLRPNARVVNVSSFVSKRSLDKCSPELQAKYVTCNLHSSVTLSEPC